MQPRPGLVKENRRPVFKPDEQGHYQQRRQEGHQTGKRGQNIKESFQYPAVSCIAEPPPDFWHVHGE